jgi:2,3-oxidosqualene cyclase
MQAGHHRDAAFDHLLSLQHDNGCWEGEMAWCTMILSQYVIVQHLAGRKWHETTRAGIIRHYQVTRTPEGAWGLHPESGGYVFTTTLAYVALRLLGLPADDPLLSPARMWLHRQPGGVLAIPTWGKFWLALIDLYGYEGVNPCPPELFILPPWLPFHPSKYYCHTRHIYLAIAFLYGCRFRGQLGPIVHELRRELYGVPYERIDFAAHRNAVATDDLYVRPSALLRTGYDLLTVYEAHAATGWREKALDFCFERILYEQRASRYQGLSPVNALLNCLAILARDPHHPELAPSLAGLESWKWADTAEGIRYAGARSQTWDTAFALQALLAAPEPSPAAALAVRRGYRFLRGAQLREDIPERRREGRDSILGGWCFSDGAHRWPVSDCTAEALSAILAVHERPSLVTAEDRIGDEQLRQAVAFILDRQNPDGGFGTYERRRGSTILENINPSEMYGSCMTERSYLECTASCLAALAHFRSAQPGLMSEAVERAIAGAVRFLKQSQRRDGSWPGFWGINFTYAIFHAVKSLRAAGVAASDHGLQRAAAWVIQKQHHDGGWGEHYSSCLRNRYVSHPHSLTVQTSWALLALLEILDPHADPIRRGIAWLQDHQRPDGSWVQEAVTGVFFGTAMLDYRLYKSYFPAWALARHAKRLSEPRPKGSGATAAPSRSRLRESQQSFAKYVPKR